MDYVEMQEDRERKQLERIGAAMSDKAIAFQMFDLIQCLSKQGHPTARKIVIAVMTYEPPQPYMELADADLF